MFLSQPILVEVHKNISMVALDSHLQHHENMLLNIVSRVFPIIFFSPHHKLDAFGQLLLPSIALNTQMLHKTIKLLNPLSGNFFIFCTIGWKGIERDASWVVNLSI